MSKGNVVNVQTEFRSRRRLAQFPGIVALLLALVFSTGCSVRKLALNKVADTLAGSGTVFSTDEDPELIRDAAPLALKLVEAMLQEIPENPSLLLYACQGFTQYGYAFVEIEALRVEPDSYREASRLRQRALRLYLRSLDYCFHGIELQSPGLVETLKRSPETALTTQGEAFKDVNLIYWTAAAWGAAISLGLDRPELVADAPAVRALLERALEINENYNHGALHDAMLVVEALPEHMGGSLERARQHFDRSIEISRGRLVGPYVTWASKVSLRQQNRSEFEEYLNKALEIDPYQFEDDLATMRLSNLVAQDLARILLSQADDLILDDL